MVPFYEKQVYTAILGKVIGVYLGRPLEGREKNYIQNRWGEITHYVHEDCNVPLVVADDDISGTLTFIRALEDSGLYEKTPDDFFGKTWLNYLIPLQTVLWWGGMSNSTEHTAYIRLCDGYSSPESGSAALNGKEVSEQIGAQIFIDAFGMVAPGNPVLAAELAGKAARVSHDGEAVYAAQVVAGMVSIAFEEKDMDTILDKAIQLIPEDSLIAQIHKDVRAWAKQYPDWNDTFDEIDRKYGYKIYGGNCHVVPNHAIMVMAWAYAKNDFFKAMSIINTAGWDTDCNAANVGSVSALVAGLENLDKVVDFQTPFADQLLIPTADGTRSISDVLEHALFIAGIGRKVMKMESIPAPKQGARYHFEMPRALHGFMPDNSSTVTRNNSAIKNIAAPEDFLGERCMEYCFRTSSGCISRIATPLMPLSMVASSYQVPFTPSIYSNNTLSLKGKLGTSTGALRMFLKLADGTMIYSDPAQGNDQGTFTIQWTPQFHGIAAELGLERTSAEAVEGKDLIDCISISGTSKVCFPAGEQDFTGYLSSMSGMRPGFSNDKLPGTRYFISNTQEGSLITGDRTWGDLNLEAQFVIHAADRSGLLFHYQGLQRWHGVLFNRNKIQLIRRFYGESVLAETDFAWQENIPMQIVIRCCNSKITVCLDGKEILSAQDDIFTCGGAGVYVHHGTCGLADFTAEAKVVHG